MTDAERARWARPSVDPEVAARYRQKGWWGDDTLREVIAGHAEANPDGDAYITDVGRLTWSAYDRAIDALAGAIVAAGVEPGERVGILLPDSGAVHVALTGVGETGATAVGIGRRAGEREIKHLLERTGAKALITLAENRGEPCAEMVARLRADGLGLAHHIVVPEFEAVEASDWAVTVDGNDVPVAELPAPDSFAGRALGPDDLFLINSTSGTTGMPKCVMHNQNRWFYFHQCAAANGGLSGDDVYYGAVPAPFGFGLWTSHFTPNIVGAPTVVTERFDADRALELIERERVSVLSCVSTQFIMMLNSDGIEQRDLSSLRVMFTGGELVPYQRAKAFEERTGCTVLQFYGSNETGLLSGTTLDDDLLSRLRTAGKIHPDMEVRLFDPDTHEEVSMPGEGQPGCRGPATCMGYLDDDDANAKLFTHDGWMLMGDICTIGDDGYLSVTGRTSDIIIRGGKNISAGQVEDEVNEHPDILLAAAVAAPDEVFGERVCVYAEVAEGSNLTLESLTDFLRERGVSREIFPELLEIVDELPRSSGAKVAKGLLRADLQSRMAGRS